MSTRLDLTGQRFGRLVVIHEVASQRTIVNKRRYWLCACDCGSQSVVPTTDLRAGNTRSCGCTQGRIYDVTGKKFGRLTAIKSVGSADRKKGRIWLCRCLCGNEVRHTVGELTKYAKSCGCLTRERRKARAFKDITGMVYGKLTVIAFVGPKPVGTRGDCCNFWVCKCKCGGNIECSTSALASGNCKSCGCGRRDRLEDKRLPKKCKSCGVLFAAMPFGVYCCQRCGWLHRKCNTEEAQAILNMIASTTILENLDGRKNTPRSS